MDTCWVCHRPWSECPHAVTARSGPVKTFIQVRDQLRLVCLDCLENYVARRREMRDNARGAGGQKSR